MRAHNAEPVRLADLLQNLVPLLRCHTSIRYCLVQLRPHRGYDGLSQIIQGYTMLAGNLSNGFSCSQLRLKLFDCEAEPLRDSHDHGLAVNDPAWTALATDMWREALEELALCDALLGLVGLRLRHVAGGDGRINGLLPSQLQVRRKLAGADAENRCQLGEEDLAILAPATRILCLRRTGNQDTATHYHDREQSDRCHP